MTQGTGRSYQEQLFVGYLGGRSAFLLDPSYMDLPEEVFASQAGPLQRALAEMKALEGGAIANQDEQRMVGHYWLRAPELAPTQQIRDEIQGTLARIKAFCADVHAGRKVSGGGAGPFRNVLAIGIGGSALGPQMVAAALGGLSGSDREARSAAVIDREARSAAVIDREARSAAVIDREARGAAVIDREARSAAVIDREARSAAVIDREARSAAVTDRMRPFFIDNTDPDGIARTLTQIGATTAGLAETLVLIISKSGGTKETRNGQLLVKAAFAQAGLDFASHAVAITGDGSELYQTATREKWRDIFPMWDWVGGRTSELSAVGLLPAGLQGIDIDELLHGARDMDVLTRAADPRQNPAAILALCWRRAVELGRRDMVVLPYKDRLELFSRYLQQLVMESLGKERDRQGQVVHEGIAVYGNKGSTDQHAYVQQLRDGVNNFFVTFIEVLKDHAGAGGGPEVYVEPQVTSGDYLLGFLLGTREALHEGGRLNLTLTVEEVSPYTLGALIALYERAVGLYASLVDINAYNQPGVEAGKKAAAQVLTLQRRVQEALGAQGRTAPELAAACGAQDQEVVVFKVLEHLSANGRAQRELADQASPLQARYRL